MKLVWPPVRIYYFFGGALVFGIIMAIQTSFNFPNTNPVNFFFLFPSNYMTWVLFIPFFYGLLQAEKFRQQPVMKKILIMTGLSIFVSLVELFLSNTLFYLTSSLYSFRALPDIWDDFRQFFFRAYMTRYIDFWFVFGTVLIIDAYTKVTRQRKRITDLELSYQTAKMEALRMQLNPHFLFNALHSINTRIGVQNDLAQQTVIRLSELLRFVLNSQQEEWSTLQKEVNFLETYLNIERQRFEDQLEVNFHIDERLEMLPLPSLLLQPVVENSIKHGFTNHQGIFRITIEATLSDDTVRIAIEDNGGTEDHEIPKTGVGLKNVRDRLQLHYGDKASLYTEKRIGGFHTLISLPYEDTNYHRRR